MVPSVMRTTLFFCLLSAPAVLLSSCQTFYTQMASREADGLAGLHAALAGVHDHASADRAAIAVDQYGSLLMQDVKGIFAQGKPNLLELYKLKNDYQSSNLKPLAKQTLAELFRLYRNNFYGSVALRNAFAAQLAKL